MSLNLQTLQGRTWNVVSVSPSSTNAPDSFSFELDTSNRIMIKSQGSTWASCDTVSGELIATLSDGRRVRITQNDDTHLTGEYLESSTESLVAPGVEVGVGTLVGLFVGALVGLVFSEPLIGGVAGGAAGAAASTVALLASGAQDSGGTSGAVFVAESGSGSGREILTYGPRAATA